jgi:adenosine deaminase
MRDGYPLVELHRHLDGNVRLETVLDLARSHGVELPADDPEALRPHVQITEPEPDLLAFLAKFGVLRRVMVDYDAVRRIARENVEDAAAEGIDYLELRFSPWFMAEEHGLDPHGVVEAVCDGIEEALSAPGEAERTAAGLPPRARLIGIISRNYGTEVGWTELDAALAGRGRGVVALDLAGDEANWPGELFVDHFRKAREEGLHTVAHAGEADGAQSVRQAVLELEAERIGHGIRAVEDDAVMELLAERGTPLEVCPTSNVHTSTVASLAEHPLPRLLERGLIVTLNTDDPSISGIDLEHEYRVARDDLGFTGADLRRCQENALAAAFLSDGERQALQRR